MRLWSVSKEERVVTLANPRSLRRDLLNQVIHTVIFVLGYSVNVSKYAAESLNSYNILELEHPREKEPLLQIIIRVWSATGRPEGGCVGNVGRK